MTEEKLTIDLIRPREEVFKYLDWLTSEPAIMSTHGQVLGNVLLGQVEGFFFNANGTPKGMTFIYADGDTAVVTYLRVVNYARRFREMFYDMLRSRKFIRVRSITNYNPKVIARLFDMEIKHTILEKELF